MKSRVKTSKLPNANCRTLQLEGAERKLPNANCRTQIAERKLPNANLRVLTQPCPAQTTMTL